MDAVKLDLGTLIEIEGSEYVVLSYMKTVDQSGCSLSIVAQTPILALRLQEKVNAQAKAIEASGLAGELMIKYKDDLMGGPSS